ncbi:MAG: hypothetical protein ABSF26_11570 [Thermoguttaceae bacterium]|jgi:hypothetical protein
MRISTARHPQHRPAGRVCDRRRFLEAAVAIPAALAAAQPLHAEAPVSQAKPAEATPMPQIRLGKHPVSRLILGVHDFVGAHMPFHGKDAEAYYTPERILQTLRHCEDLGINAWQAPENGPLLDTYIQYRRAGGKMFGLALTHGSGKDEDLRSLAKTEGIIGIAHHGEVTDRLFKEGKFDLIRDRLSRIRDTGLLVGISTHMPAVVDAVESKGWDLDYYMTCVYERNRSEADLVKLIGRDALPVGEPFLKSDPPRMFRAIQQTKRPCLAFKILAAGRRRDVAQAFRETFAAIKATDAVIVGIYDRYTDQAAENAALTRRYGAAPR